MNSPRRGQSTKEAILEHACKIFAEKGYRGATHAEICAAAGANVASINYYYESKENLYKAAFDHLTRRMERLYPLDGGLPDTAPPEARFHAFVHAQIQRLFDPDNLGARHRIRLLEVMDPTGLLEPTLSRQLEQNRKVIQHILRDLFGAAVPQRMLDWCEMSIVGQCHIAFPGPGACGGPRKIFGLDASSVDALTEHIVRFSLAGIHELRRIHEKKEDTSECD